ncbi:MAG TPA: hypothetical protein VFQ53_34010 [Kofleriaceae bacterium]|nr:hypothetical protein [Kofleriaceae bacterium]
MRILLAVLPGLAIACSSPSSVPAPALSNAQPTSNQPDVRAFALRMVEVMEKNDLDGWRGLLSERKRAQHADATQLNQQFQIWRRELLPKAELLRRADFTLDTTSPQHFVVYQIEGKPAEALALVVEERGTLRLDEN